MKHTASSALVTALPIWVACLIFCVVAFSAEAEPAVADQALALTVDEALRPGVAAGASVAVRIIDADTGEVLLATENVSQPFTPASNMKLVSSATALDRFGPERQLQTHFAVADGALLIRAGGDPAFGDPSLLEEIGLTPMSLFDQLVEYLHKANITGLPGGVIVIDDVFDDQFVHPSWHPANLLHWYGAPVAGVNFNDNCIGVTFKPAQLGQPAELHVIPPAGGFELRGQAVTSGLDEHAPELAKLPGVDVFEVGGKVGRVGGPYSKPITNPRRFVAETTAAALRDRGFEVGPDIRLETEYTRTEPATVVASFATPLTDVLRRVNTNSQNMMAEAVAKLNGLAFDTAAGADSPRGTWEGGHRAAVDFLDRIGVDPSPLIAADGSGLSRDNRLTAELLSDLLLYMLTEHQHGEHFVQTLAISGVRGSVRNRMGRDELAHMKGRVYAKTGTIRGVSALSGYVFHPSGRTLVFSILHNGIEGSATPYRQQQDAAVAAMWSWLDAQPPLESDVLDARSPQLLESLEAVAP